jgi:hypothetical protein
MNREEVTVLLLPIFIKNINIVRTLEKYTSSERHVILNELGKLFEDIITELEKYNNDK